MSKIVKVDEVVHREVMMLKRKYKYTSLSELINDMSTFFTVNDISPRTAKEPVVKKIASFRESLFKKLGAYERDYYKAHYNDFNIVSGFIKDKFENLEKMIAHYGSGNNKPSFKNDLKVEPIEPKKTDEHVAPKQVLEDSVDLEERKKKQLEGLEYIVEMFEKKMESKGDQLVLDKSNLISFKKSIENLIKR